MENYFSTNLKYLRTSNNDTQQSLADKINSKVKDENDKISPSAIGRWENDDRDPSVLNVIRVADVYGISIADIVGKDLRIEDNHQKGYINIDFFTKALIEKGYLKSGEMCTTEEFDKLLELYEIMKK